VGKLTYQVLNGCQGIIDIWGDMLGAHLLPGVSGRDKPLDVTFQSIRDALQVGASQPFPLFTAALAQSGAQPQDYKWLEVSPYWSGFAEFQAWVPTSQFGSEFDNGNLVSESDELALSWLMGVFGSAFAMNADFVTNNFGQGFINSLPSILRIPIQKALGVRLSPPTVANFMNGAEQQDSNYAGFPTTDGLSFVDAGFAVDLPVPPVLRPERQVDVIIVLDAFGPASQQDQPWRFQHLLEDSAAWAANHGYRFPAIGPRNVDSPITVYESQDDPDCPVVIYLCTSWGSFPQQLDASWTSVQYDSDVSTGLSQWAYQGLQQSADVIRDVLRRHTIAS